MLWRLYIPGQKDTPTTQLRPHLEITQQLRLYDEKVHMGVEASLFRQHHGAPKEERTSKADQSEGTIR